MAQPTAPVNPSGAYPGAGSSSLGDSDNFGISDVPSNWDYTFRSGIFAGDYEAVVAEGHNPYAFFTDARNSHSSGGPAGGATAPSQPGRNPTCEQSDVFVDRYGSFYGGRTGGGRARLEDRRALPRDAVSKGRLRQSLPQGRAEGRSQGGPPCV